jgi:peptidoglycan hydrolase-like protein with peptidoglycan-binding domain
MMRKLIRKLLLGTASVLALGIGGAALDYAVDAGNPVNAATMPPAAQTSDSSMTGDALRKDDIRWAQVELRHKGLYKGSLDGILGPETRRALGQFQKNNGLGRTASLDAQTWEALTSDPGIGQGSSKPAAPERTERSNLGR